MSYEIRNDKLLREAYESGRRQGLNEQGEQFSLNSGPPSPEPLLPRYLVDMGDKVRTNWSRYFYEIYGPEFAPSIHALLLDLWGPEWMSRWLNVMHDKYFNWPGFTYYPGYGYAIILPPGCTLCTAYIVQFIDGVWMWDMWPYHEPPA